MSGHSKWASIKHKKGAADAKRGKVFSKYAKLISVAAKEGGGDVDMNFTLRMYVDKAKAANMPKDVIDRAIAKGAGTGGEADQMKSAVYECMGPGGAAMVIETLTDNSNRTLGNIKTICNKHGGNFGAKVLWMFDQKGVVRVQIPPAMGGEKGVGDELELALIEAGAEDIDLSDGTLTVTSAVPHLKEVIFAINDAGLDAKNAGIEYVAKDHLSVSEEDEEKLFALMEAIEEDDDVTNVYTNVG